jgi:hypothetical protein
MITFRHGNLFGRAGQDGEIRFRHPRFRASEPPPHWGGTPHLDLANKARALLGIAGIVAGIYASSSSALAEVEETANQELGQPDESVPALSRDAPTNVFIEGVTNDDVAELQRNEQIYDDGRAALSSSRNPRGFDDALIPQAVWSLDVNTGAHISHVSGGLDPDLYAIFGEQTRPTDFLATAIVSTWGIQVYGVIKLSTAPPKFQSASCSGNSAEHSDLGYCSNIDINADAFNNKKSQDLDSSDSDAGTSSTSSDVLLSSPSSPNSQATFPQPVIAPMIPATTYMLPVQGTLNLLGSCGGASCLTIQIGPTETTAFATPSQDWSTSPNDGLTPSIDPIFSSIDPPPSSIDPPPSSIDPPSSGSPIPAPIIHVIDPGPGLSLQPPPQPLKPIPEASTWVMTIIGFGAMISVFGRKRRPRANPISIIDVS